ncbi:MAG: hypothetical protein Q4B99_06215 [Clostridia bacterium]|nr:hypothetical protein [Clostridia bacterium]
MEAKRRIPPKSLRVLIPVAACLCAAVFALAVLSPGSVPQFPDQEGPFAGALYLEVESPDDFLSIGVELRAPDGAENVRCSILGGDAACMDFELHSNAYYVMASTQDGDISGIAYDVTSSRVVDTSTGAVLYAHSDGTSVYWKLQWRDGEQNCFLCNLDGASEAAVLEAYAAVISANAR